LEKEEENCLRILLHGSGTDTDDAGANSVSVGRTIVVVVVVVVVVRESVDVLDGAQEVQPELFLFLLVLAEVFANLHLNRNDSDAANECCRVVILRILRADMLVCIQAAVLHLLVTDPIPMVEQVPPRSTSPCSIEHSAVCVCYWHLVAFAACSVQD
jgi:hypothetical protein